MEGVGSPELHFVVAYFVLVTIPEIVALSLKTLLSQVFELLMARGGRCSVFLTMRCFNDAMFSNS